MGRERGLVSMEGFTSQIRALMATGVSGGLLHAMLREYMRLLILDGATPFPRFWHFSFLVCVCAWLCMNA